MSSYITFNQVLSKWYFNGLRFSGHNTKTFEYFINLLYSYDLRVLPFKYSKSDDQLEHDTVTQMASTIYDEQVSESKIDHTHKTDTIVSNIRNGRTTIFEVDYD